MWDHNRHGRAVCAKQEASHSRQEIRSSKLAPAHAPHAARLTIWREHTDEDKR
eukprot:CAMPEP_0181193996 /NCGR_PEP_ID=MMETSP1096-20121128/14108_1 /TAXON_ID=156174 ORGANISM="Chrysochromulina ericina, Strain CCMP281" /NCGR_SAMPLE_ID=MMETSP1096 /ASSEMBLY_ACC=CAM_ASM_000453 /LENGTH=52 /DNA_ID=CAMNT_0023283483 /DNA_START=399 /DNA_END=557 /DNA_ORIENTATION=-